MQDSKYLIEDFLPLSELNNASKKSTEIHRWWARRPLAACRAAIFSSLVKIPSSDSAKDQQITLVKRLCQNPVSQPAILEAIRCVYESQAVKLSNDRELVIAEDIEACNAEKPRLLDIFAGAGTIPLEALRLGCAAYAVELNPVAHVIELATLVYPQKYGATLIQETKKWADWMISCAEKDLAEFYPTIPSSDNSDRLTPSVYLWTRTAKCQRSVCNQRVPLVRQTWLRKKEGNYVALKIDSDPKGGGLRFTKVQSAAKDERKALLKFGFDPGSFSKKGETACFCGKVAESDYLKSEGQAGRIGQQLMAVVCKRERGKGNIYFSANEICEDIVPDRAKIRDRIEKICRENKLTLPQEELVTDGKGAIWAPLYGYKTFDSLFTSRQLLALLTFTKYVRSAHQEMLDRGYEAELAKAVTVNLSFLVDRLAQFNCSSTRWKSSESNVEVFAFKGIPLAWDFVEIHPFSSASGNIAANLELLLRRLAELINVDSDAVVIRTSATELPFAEGFFDLIVTDPPYYDNEPYAAQSDFFYVWLKRTIGFLFPEHFSGALTPKREEIVSDKKRHGGRKQAERFYEDTMTKALKEAWRVLKPDSPMVLIYAHKNTAGWSTLVDALRNSGFAIQEAWPIEMETPGRTRGQNASALKSNIFLVARKRKKNITGSYEEDVQPALIEIVKERADTLLRKGVVDTDLVIACVGAGLKPFTRFERVELANGKEVTSKMFLQTVEGTVLDTVFGKLGLSDIDSATRFYVMWRHMYGRAPIDSGEAIVFAYPLGLELDGSTGLSSGRTSLLEKKGKKYRIKDFTERGEDLDDLEAGGAPIIDVLHRLLWLYENMPYEIPAFLNQVMPNIDAIKLTAQALAGTELGGGTTLVATTLDEKSALSRLLSNWNSIISQDILARKW
jgi:putative DNA methylase